MHDKKSGVFDMIIDLLKLKQEGKQNVPFNFSYKANDGLISIPEARFDGEVQVFGTAFIEGRKLFAEISVKYTLIGECSRCLDRATETVEQSFSATFSEHPEEDEYIYKSGKVDLTFAVEQEIIVNQPTVIYCKSDCKGLCHVCGANLNKTDCGHGQT